MPSPGAVADAIEYSLRGHARVTAELAQQSLAATAAELQKANGMLVEEAATGWLWASYAEALEDIMAEVQSRHPNDPLFSKVSGVCQNGTAKTVLHQKLEAAFNRHMTATGPVKDRVLQRLSRFWARRKF